jgi:hypothetical protein
MMTMMTTKLPDIVPADLAGALDELGISYIIRGDEAMALCPSPDHFDNTPSWSINLDTGKHHCFSCGFGGSFQWLTQIVKGMRAPEAVAWIKTRKIRVGLAQEPQDNPQRLVRESDLYVFGDPPADAMAERQVTEEACRAHEVLFNHEKNEWVFLLRDPWNGRLIGWQTKGRGENSHIVDNYPPKMQKSVTVFGYPHLRTTGTTGPVIVVENPVKATKFLSAGIPRVVATCGASFTDYQINELLWPLADEVIFCLDNDSAGFKRVSRFIQESPYARGQVRVFAYPGAVKKINGAYVHEADDRDPGDLCYAELWDGYLESTPASFTYFKGVDWT